MSLTAWTKSWVSLNVIKYLDAERFGLVGGAGC
jgi:hypothetical protein